MRPVHRCSDETCVGFESPPGRWRRPWTAPSPTTVTAGGAPRQLADASGRQGHAPEAQSRKDDGTGSRSALEHRLQRSGTFFAPLIVAQPPGRFPAHLADDARSHALTPGEGGPPQTALTLMASAGPLPREGEPDGLASKPSGPDGAALDPTRIGARIPPTHSSSGGVT